MRVSPSSASVAGASEASVAALVTLSRDLLLGTSLYDPRALFFAVAVSLVCFLFSWRMFHLVEPRIAERV